MRHWTIEQKRLDIEVVHNEYTEEEQERMMDRMDEEDQVAAVTVSPPPLPDKFTSFTKWRTFSEGFKGHCAVLRGCMKIPIVYVLRDHEVVTDEMMEAEYPTTDKRLMTLVRLAGADYARDNIRVWELLRPLVRETPAWNYVKQYDDTQNGRMAFLVLQTRGEGEAALDARRSAAENIIQTAKFTGKSKRFTMQSYINLLQGAFTELETCGPEYALTDKQKVKIFTKGMVSKDYEATKASIYQNAETRDDWQRCYAFVETMEQFRPDYSDERTFERNISETNKHGAAKGGDSSYRSPAQWAALSREERDKILSARGKKKGGDGKKQKRKDKKEAHKRKLEELMKTATEELAGLTGGTDATANPNNVEAGTPAAQARQPGQPEVNPADQFGRKAHAIRTILTAVAEASRGGGTSNG